MGDTTGVTGEAGHDVELQCTSKIMGDTTGVTGKAGQNVELPAR